MAAGHRTDLVADAAGDVRLRADEDGESTEQPLIPLPAPLVAEVTLERVRKPGGIGRLVATLRAGWRTRGSAA